MPDPGHYIRSPRRQAGDDQTRSLPKVSVGHLGPTGFGVGTAGGPALTSRQRRAFFDDGFVYLRGAFDVSAAREMENAVWSVLSRSGVHRDNRETWSSDYECHLQAGRKQDRPPAEIPAVRLVLDDLFGAGTWIGPRDWGQVLLTFPTAPPWSPRGGLWHLDHPFSLPGSAITGVTAFLFVADVGEQGGGTLILRGSPALVARFVAEGGEVGGEKMATTRRRFLGSREVLREMTRASGSDLARFMVKDFDIDGVSVRVIELTGKAGDIVVCHPWALHSPSANVADRPRIMRASRIYRRPPGLVGDAGVPPRLGADRDEPAAQS